MPEDPPSTDSPATPSSPNSGASRGAAAMRDGSRLAGTVAGHLTNQARQTATAARAGRVVNKGEDPGVLDLTPMRDLLAELMDELGKLRFRDRVARALRRAADIIDAPPRGQSGQ